MKHYLVEMEMARGVSLGDLQGAELQRMHVACVVCCVLSAQSSARSPLSALRISALGFRFDRAL